ncbi:MAG: ROK family protein [Clostridium sp.]|nr:ROK family protein [Clostridium sp.]
MNLLGRGFNQENIQDMNRTLLLNLLRKEGVCARAHLANLSQLKQATVTNIVSDFIDWGLVKEVGFLVGSKGRRSIGISINNDDFGVLAIRLARKNYTVGVFDLSGRLLDKERTELDVNQQPKITFEAIINDAGKLIKSLKSRKIIAIGMAIPGPYSEKRGRIELMTGVLGWNEVPIRETLQDIFKMPVFVEQDANAGALAQYWHNDEDYKNGVVVYIAVGQGVGAGIINNGELLKGCIGVAGEIGHTSISFDGPRCACGNYGCLENYCSSIAFTREVNRVMAPEKEYTFRQVSQLVREGNRQATEIFLDACDKLSIGVVNIVNSFNPSVIVIGDEMSHVVPSVMLERVKENVKQRVLPEIYANMNITMSVVSNDSMAHGAAIVAINDIFNNPLRYFEKGQA